MRDSHSNYLGGAFSVAALTDGLSASDAKILAEHAHLRAPFIHNKLCQPPRPPRRKWVIQRQGCSKQQCAVCNVDLCGRVP